MTANLLMTFMLVGFALSLLGGFLIAGWPGATLTGGFFNFCRNC
jgi:hypothetical protein